MILWLLRQGFSQTGVMAFISLFFVSGLVVELPSGLWADRYGRKWIIAIGSALQAGGAACLACMAGSALVAGIGEVLLGIGAACHTGVKEAFLYDYLKERGCDGDYQRRYGESKFFEFLAMGVGAVGGVVLYQMHGPLPFFATAGCFAIGALLALCLPEPAVHIRRAPSSWQGFQRGWRELRVGPPLLRRLVCYYCWFFSLVLLLTVSLTQPYLVWIHFPLRWFGWAHFFFYACAMAGTLWAERLTRGMPGPRFFLAIGLALIGTLIALAVWHHPCMFLPLAVIYWGWGTLLPSVSCAINRLVGSSQRAVILSIQDAGQTAVFILAAVGVGYGTDAHGLAITFLALGTVSLGCLLLTVVRS